MRSQGVLPKTRQLFEEDRDLIAYCIVKPSLLMIEYGLISKEEGLMIYKDYEAFASAVQLLTKGAIWIENSLLYYRTE